MSFNHDQFIADFKKEWQQAIVKKMLDEKKCLTFKLHSIAIVEYSKTLLHVMGFVAFLRDIGFLRHDGNWHYELNHEFVPKNQR